MEQVRHEAEQPTHAKFTKNLVESRQVKQDDAEMHVAQGFMQERHVFVMLS
jgi:hypothetical protein